MKNALITMILPAFISTTVPIAKNAAAQPATVQSAPTPFEKLGSFIGRGSGRISLVGPGPNGTERFYIVHTYLSSMDIVAYTPGEKEPKVWQHSQGGAFAMELGPDNRIYIGTYYEGHILRLDPQTEQLDDLGPALPSETYIWQFATGSDKQIYAGTFPNAKLIRIDPATGKVTDLGRMDAREKYVRALVADSDGWLYGATGPEKSNLFAYNIASEERRDLIPEADRAPGFPTIIKAADGAVYATANKKHFKMKNGAMSAVETIPRAAPRDILKNGERFENPNTYVGRFLNIYRLGLGPDKKIYGSSALPQYFLRYDPQTQKRETIGLIPGAQAYGLLPAHDKLYITSYGGATMQIFDPSKPFNPGTKRENNPSYYGPTAPNQGRPYDLTLGSDGKVYIADVPTYGYYGGALAWHDPQTDKVEHVPTPIENQSLTAICALLDNRLIVGTSTSGGSGTTERKAKEAVLFEWDTVKKTVTWQGAPFPGIQSVSNLAFGGDGLVYGSADGEIFVFDPKGRTLKGKTKLTQGSVTRAGMETLKDGRVIALAGNSALLLRFADGKWQNQEFARYEAPLNVGKAELDGFFYAASGDQLLRCPIPAEQ